MRARTLAVAILLLTPQLVADGDPRVAWLARSAIPIRSLDPADTDFRDLERLRPALKDVRVVMLGEQNHGDGTTFLAKTRMVRFLHERMGFDVLAFESGLYDCAKAWELLAKGEPGQKAVRRGVFRIWTESREVQPLIDYIETEARSDHPLELAGVDNQLTGSASTDFLVSDLAAVLSAIDPKLAKGAEWDRVADVIAKAGQSSWENGTAPVPSEEEQRAFARTIEQWCAAIAAHDPLPPSRPWSGAFWRRFLTGLRSIAEQEWRTDPNDRIGNPAAFTMRDIQMGKNLAWLANERYPKRKIIVWAATFHNARNIRTIDAGPKYAKLYAGETPMGEEAGKTLGRRLYSIGFIAHEGEFASAFARKVEPIPVPSRDSVEDLCARASLDGAFIDFRSAPAWLRTPMAGSIVSHTEMHADWTRVVDGVVFMRRMDRSHRIADQRSEETGAMSIDAFSVTSCEPRCTVNVWRDPSVMRICRSAARFSCAAGVASTAVMTSPF